MRRLCQMCGEPLALTSANISSHTSTVAAHVSEEKCRKEKRMHKLRRFNQSLTLVIDFQYVSQHLNSGWNGFLYLCHSRLQNCSLILTLLCFPSEGVSGALAKTSSGGGWRTNRRPEPPRINSRRPISTWQIPHHQTRLVSSSFVIHCCSLQMKSCVRIISTHLCTTF